MGIAAAWARTAAAAAASELTLVVEVAAAVEGMSSRPTTARAFCESLLRPDVRPEKSLEPRPCFLSVLLALAAAAAAFVALAFGEVTPVPEALVVGGEAGAGAVVVRAAGLVAAAVAAGRGWLVVTAGRAAVPVAAEAGRVAAGWVVAAAGRVTAAPRPVSNNDKHYQYQRAENNWEKKRKGMEEKTDQRAVWQPAGEQRRW